MAESARYRALEQAGLLHPGAEAVLAEGINAYFSLCPGPIALEEAMTHTALLLERATAQAVRAFLAGSRMRAP